MQYAKLKASIKNSKLLYNCYFRCGSLLLRFVGKFVKTDPDLILFASYGGRKYDDSPRVVYEYLKNHPVSQNHKLVWGFVNPEEYPEVENKIKIDTIPYYLTSLKAGYWITNSSISRGLDFKKKATKNILFQHGMVGIKRIFTDVVKAEDVFVSGFNEQYDMVFIEGKHEIPVISRVWHLPERVFYQTGLPRNDDLIVFSDEEVKRIKDKLGIPGDKKVILYAPTFRDYYKAKDGSSALHIPIDFAKWRNQLGNEYVLLITAHYEVAQLLESLPENNFVINAFGYPRVNDLLKVADLMISDYSSIVFDYSILERPIFCYGYDYDTFLSVRGTYTDLSTLFKDGVIRDEESLLKAISTIDYNAHCEYTRINIKDKYIASYGNAAEKAVKIIFDDSRE